MQKTLSITIGKGSITHNNRNFYADYIDSTRSKNNIIFHKENIREVYRELFGAALAEYNAKQKRKDRIIKDYYDHIFHSKQEKPFYELIIQVGNKDDTHCNSDDGRLAAQILIEFEKDFQKRNPHIRVFNSVLHMDEHTPHLHIDFVPFATNQKRGLSTRNALTKALEQQGFIAKGKFDTSSKLWIDSEKEKLSEIMQRYGIEWKKLGTHNNHLSVLDFKKQERKKEIVRLENKIECTDNILKNRWELLDDTERIIDELDGEYQEKKENISRLDNEITEKENVLAETISIISENNSLIEASADKVSKIKNIDDIQARKTLFGDNVTVSQEDYNNLSELAKKQIAAENNVEELTEKVAVLEKDNAALVNKNKSLNNELQLVNSLRDKLNFALREISDWKNRYQKVMDFIEQLGLKEKLREFLKPVQHRSRYKVLAYLYKKFLTLNRKSGTIKI